MTDPQQIIDVLEQAREMVAEHWGTKNPAVSLEDAHGSSCASVAIRCSVAGVCEDILLAAHAEFLRGAGLPVPADEDAIYQAVYAFNDAQTNVDPVLVAFTNAIRLLRAENATPKADCLIDVSAACEAAAEIIAPHIVAAHPQMDAHEMAILVSGELFGAAQDCIRVAAHAARA